MCHLFTNGLTQLRLVSIIKSQTGIQITTYKNFFNSEHTKKIIPSGSITLITRVNAISKSYYSSPAAWTLRRRIQCPRCISQIPGHRHHYCTAPEWMRGCQAWVLRRKNQLSDFYLDMYVCECARFVSLIWCTECTRHRKFLCVGHIGIDFFFLKSLLKYFSMRSTVTL